MERQQYEEAEEMFNECISSEPRFVLGWANKARVAQVLGK
jgi:Tfp pilus assembly protein PilF